MYLREEMENFLRSVHFLDSPVIWKIRAHSLATKVDLTSWGILSLSLYLFICIFPNKDREGWPDKLGLAPSCHGRHIHQLGGYCVQQHLRKEDWLTILNRSVGPSVIGKNTALLLVITSRENTLRRGVRSDVQSSCTETRFQKCHQSGKNSS